MKRAIALFAAVLGGANAPAVPAEPVLSQWVGVWVSGDKLIEIRPALGGTLAIAGEAYWGGQDPERVAHGGVHEADFSVQVTPHGGRLGFAVSGATGEAVADDADDALCHVTLELVGTRLVVDNPDECGGAYVTFTAEYRRRPPHRRR